MNIAAIFAEFIAFQSKERSDGSYDRANFYITKFLHHAGDMPVTDLRANHVNDWVDDDFATASDSTVRTAIGTIVSAINWAAKPEQALIGQNPIKGMERPAPESRETYISDEEWALIWDAKMSNALRDAVLFLRLTGCRPHELRTLEARHVHGDRLVFPRKESKGGRRKRTILMSAEAQAIVYRLVRQHPTGKLFRNNRGSDWTGDTLWRAIKRLGDRVGVQIMPYSFRHTFATNALTKGVDPLTVAQMMGHSTLHTLQQTYSHLMLAGDHMKRAVEIAQSAA